MKNLDWKINEIRNYLIEEINQNELISKKHKRRCRVLNYVDHLLIVIYAITGCISISAFAYLDGITIGITSSAIGWKICATTAGSFFLFFETFYFVFKTTFYNFHKNASLQ